MADSDYQKLLHEVAELKRRLGSMVQPGTVKEIKGDKLRMVMDKKSDNPGEEPLSPWLETSHHRGGGRETRAFKEGQNLMMISPNGDPSAAVLIPYSPNKNNRRPDHAGEHNKDEETFQLDDLRVKKTKNGYAIWLQEPQQQQDQQQQQQQGGQSGGGKEEEGGSEKHQHQKQSPDGRVLLRLHNDGGVEARVKNGSSTMRFTATKEGVKMKAGSDFAVVQKGKLFVSKPWKLGQDPMKDSSDTDV